MKFSLDDTIAAIATPIGEGAIGIVKISGPKAKEILEKLFHSRKTSRTLLPYHLTYGNIDQPGSNEIVDEVLVVYMPAPHSYTRQDVAEIHSHGGIVPLRRILQLTLELGARLAEPGEMTLRAFVNGRLDLIQAEAVLDIVRSRTEAALRVASMQLGGRLSAQVKRIRQSLIERLAYLEASIDFVEDEIPDQYILPPLQEAAKDLEHLIENARHGVIYRNGIHSAIIGRPNVGKSSLLNALLRGERAIVTSIPGTTRDTLEETVNIRGIPLVLVDTAGIRAHTNDDVERLGIQRSQAALTRADLALLVIDSSEPITELDHAIANMVADKPAIVVLNKSDLGAQTKAEELLPAAPHLAFCAKDGTGLEHLEDAISNMVLGGEVTSSELPVASNPRHQALLKKTTSHVQMAIETQLKGMSPDFVSIDLREAVNTLGEITGETVTDDLLNMIFSNFCIGK